MGGSVPDRCLPAGPTGHTRPAFDSRKLYGREREIRDLARGPSIASSPAAGRSWCWSPAIRIGKSAVVMNCTSAGALAWPFRLRQVRSVQARHPYATLAQAFQSLIRSLLGKSDAELAGLGATPLREALGAERAAHDRVVPELKLLIGEQPRSRSFRRSSPRSSPTGVPAVSRRLARREHPLALFLDDLQWLDAATLDMLADLLTQATCGSCWCRPTGTTK